MYNKMKYIQIYIVVFSYYINKLCCINIFIRSIIFNDLFIIKANEIFIPDETITEKDVELV